MERPTGTPPPPPSWVVGLDYYFENGKMVLTARFLLARGTCCGSGCRHCPYPLPECTPPTGGDHERPPGDPGV